jgi:hypothetical protein
MKNETYYELPSYTSWMVDQRIAVALVAIGLPGSILIKIGDLRPI